MKIVNDGDADISYAVGHAHSNQPQKYGLLRPREDTVFVCRISEPEVIVHVSGGNTFETGTRKVSIELLKRVTSCLHELHRKTRSKEMKKIIEDAIDKFPTEY
jgi:hypothetical protein